MGRRALPISPTFDLSPLVRPCVLDPAGLHRTSVMEGQKTEHLWPMRGRHHPEEILTRGK